MKNLIDELHGLNDDEYKVSADFSKRVMKKIRKDKNRNKLNYVISLASVGVVACLAVVLFNNSSIESNIFNFNNKNEVVDSMKQSLIADRSFYDFDATKDSSENDKLIYNQENSNDKAYGGLENSGIDNNRNGAYSATNVTSEEFKMENSLEDMTNTIEEKEILKQGIVSTNSFQLQIESLLSQAGLEVEHVENGIKVKSTKEEVENILKEYKNIIIEVQGEYIIIKF